MWYGNKGPKCPYCGHRPFKTAKGYKWHLDNLHPNDDYVPVDQVLRGQVGRLESSDKGKRGRRRRKEPNLAQDMVEGMESVGDVVFGKGWRKKGG